ncbi:MAG: hypothetical protein HYX91_01295 [Chloroflexi bacterium]|nr:hypothetical protein [Chloroflexota bacterium]
MMEQDENTRRWHRLARRSLKLELAGIAFARKTGHTPEEYADHLWGDGALKWMGKPDPTAREYLLKEAEAFREMFPRVVFEIGKLGDDAAELTFTNGCLGGWGREQWALARSLGLGKGHVCRYCRQAFRAWSRQLGLECCPEPPNKTTCVLRVTRNRAAL